MNLIEVLDIWNKIKLLLTWIAYRRKCELLIFNAYTRCKWFVFVSICWLLQKLNFLSLWKCRWFIVVQRDDADSDALPLRTSIREQCVWDKRFSVSCYDEVVSNRLLFLFVLRLFAVFRQGDCVIIIASSAKRWKFAAVTVTAESENNVVVNCSVNWLMSHIKVIKKYDEECNSIIPRYDDENDDN